MMGVKEWRKGEVIKDRASDKGAQTHLPWAPVVIEISIVS